MTKKKFLKSFLFVFPVTALVLFSCKPNSKGKDTPQPQPEPPPSPTPGACSAATLQYNNTNCPVIGGCALTFTCENMNIPASAIMNISTLKINQPSLLQASAGNAPTNWYSSSVNCTSSGSTVTCAQFLPIASDFTIVGKLGDVDLNLSVTVENQLTPTSTTQCGQQGTTVQRMFDCSMRVKNYAGIGTGKSDNSFTPFIPGSSNPNGNWFLVSCPGTDNQQCFWLSPMMTQENPALGNGINALDSFNKPMNKAPYLNGRLLWSGISKKSYNFFEANGNAPFFDNDNKTAYYALYNLLDSHGKIDTTKMTAYTGPIYRPKNSPPYTPTPMLCNGYDDSNAVDCNSGNKQNVYAAYANVKNKQSVCSTQDGVTLLPGSVYEWQIPSYPMLYTLTGGGLDDFRECEPDGTYYKQLNACNPKGFKARSNVPGFLFDSVDATTTPLLSSSVAMNGRSGGNFIIPPYVYAFFDSSGKVAYSGLPVSVSGLADYRVRCASATW